MITIIHYERILLGSSGAIFFINIFNLAGGQLVMKHVPLKRELLKI